MVEKGNIKLADFGLARKPPFVLWDPVPLTLIVASLWYRAPELLLGANIYDYGIDIWGAGCCAYEMATGKILFSGECEIACLFKMFKKLGTPAKEDTGELLIYSEKWPKWNKQKSLKAFKEEIPGRSAKEKTIFFDVIIKCLEFNRKNRISASMALELLSELNHRLIFPKRSVSI